MRKSCRHLISQIMNKNHKFKIICCKWRTTERRCIFGYIVQQIYVCRLFSKWKTRFPRQVTCVSGIYNKNKQHNEITSRNKDTHPKPLFIEFTPDLIDISVCCIAVKTQLIHSLTK